MQQFERQLSRCVARTVRQSVRKSVHHRDRRRLGECLSENTQGRSALQHSAEAERSEGSRSLNAILETKDLAAWANLPLTLKWDEVKRRRADVGWLKSAYMVAFATWGYMYAFAPALKIVLRQLSQYDEPIIPHFKLTNRYASREWRGLFYVRRPRELEGVAVWMGQHIVLLPPHGRDITFYDRIAPLISCAENITLQGDAYYWPTEPKHTLDVQAFESPLVLPTPADVHLLT